MDAQPQQPKTSADILVIEGFILSLPTNSNLLFLYDNNQPPIERFPFPRPP